MTIEIQIKVNSQFYCLKGAVSDDFYRNGPETPFERLVAMVSSLILDSCPGAVDDG